MKSFPPLSFITLARNHLPLPQLNCWAPCSAELQIQLFPLHSSHAFYVPFFFSKKKWNVPPRTEWDQPGSDIKLYQASGIYSQTSCGSTLCSLDKGASRWHGVFGELSFSMEENFPEAAAWLNSVISIDPRAMWERTWTQIITGISAKAILIEWLWILPKGLSWSKWSWFPKRTHFVVDRVWLNKWQKWKNDCGYTKKLSE